MFDIEHELMFGDYTNRSALQRKHMILKEVRDRLIKEKRKTERNANLSAWSHKRQVAMRPFPGPPGGLCSGLKEAPPKPTPPSLKYVRDGVDVTDEVNRLGIKEPVAPKLRTGRY